MRNFKWLISLSMTTALAFGAFARAVEVEAKAAQTTQKLVQMAGVEATINQTTRKKRCPPQGTCPKPKPPKPK